MNDAVSTGVTAHQLSWKGLPFQFAWHMVIGTLMFMAVGAVTVGLHWFVGWMKAADLPDPAIWIVSILKWSLFAGDALLFAIYLARSIVHHARLFSTMEVQ